MDHVITFDFHNTLANCDRWFELEIRDLPWAVIEHLELSHSGPDRATVENSYRELRLAIIESGNEIDAYESVAIMFRQHGVDADAEAITAAIDQLMRQAIESMDPVPGAAETVRYLYEQQVKLGVISSAVHHQTLEWILDRMGILDCFDQIATSASTGYYKSTPAIYHAALSDLNAVAERSVHIGDSMRWDVETAQRAGMHAVWFQTTRREAFNTRPVASVPSAVVTSMEGAGPLLLNLLRDVQATS